MSLSNAEREKRWGGNRKFTSWRAAGTAYSASTIGSIYLGKDRSKERYEQADASAQVCAIVFIPFPH